MAKTMELYMSKTQADYGSGIARPKIDDKDHFELKGQFLKQLRDNTFSGSDHEYAKEHIKKVLEIVDLFYVPNITQDQQEPDETLYQEWERFKEILMKCPQHYLIEMQEVILFYSGLEISTRQILYSKGAIPTMTAADAKVAIQEMAKYSQKWHNGKSKTRSTETSDGLAAIQAQLNNLRREIKKVNEKVYTAQVGCVQSMEESLNNFMSESERRHEENSNMIKEIRASTDTAIRNQGALIKTFGDSNQANEKDRTVKHLKGIAKNVLVGIGKFIFLVESIILNMPEDVKVPLILERLFLSTTHAKIEVFKRKITFRVGDAKFIFKSVKPVSSLIKKVYMLSLRECMELDLEARLMRETLVLNRSLDPLYGEYIELNDLNVPLELRRDQVDDLMPTIEEGEDKVEYKGENVVGAFMNVTIFVRNFSIVTHFAAVENMDGYRDQDIGDVIFREPFCKASCVEARRFDGLITIHNGNDNVTYQMA
uniref:Reverse transcriptase domain-containing protein n=1 Tax=Tanacetum cinerariifolium TaxID=118510 RepID=A0A6L2JFW3_TANCI|nr:hypothetical protein [Tanacetum cinerariifolium]